MGEEIDRQFGGLAVSYCTMILDVVGRKRKGRHAQWLLMIFLVL